MKLPVCLLFFFIWTTEDFISHDQIPLSKNLFIYFPSINFYAFVHQFSVFSLDVQCCLTAIQSHSFILSHTHSFDYAYALCQSHVTRAVVRQGCVVMTHALHKIVYAWKWFVNCLKFHWSFLGNNNDKVNLFKSISLGACISASFVTFNSD